MSGVLENNIVDGPTLFYLVKVSLIHKSAAPLTADPTHIQLLMLREAVFRWSRFCPGRGSLCCQPRDSWFVVLFQSWPVDVIDGIVLEARRRYFPVLVGQWSRSVYLPRNTQQKAWLEIYPVFGTNKNEKYRCEYPCTQYGKKILRREKVKDKKLLVKINVADLPCLRLRVPPLLFTTS